MIALKGATFVVYDFYRSSISKNHYTSVQKMHLRFGVFKKVLNNKNNLLVKVKFMKK